MSLLNYFLKVKNINEKETKLPSSQSKYLASNKVSELILYNLKAGRKIIYMIRAKLSSSVI